jgi:cell pole-organizing protein PopZ
MATASSAQREPSMEEILASIRRIIEDSDGGRKQPGEATEPATAIETDGDEATTGAAAPEVEVFRAELRAGNADPEPTRPVSLAEVQAQLASGQPAPAPREAVAFVDSIPARPVTLAEVSARVAAEQSAGSAATPEVAEAAAGGQEADRAAAQETTAAQAAFDAPDDDPRIDIDDDDLLQDEPTQESAAETALLRPALVSEHTSRQVAAAFGELSEAFASRGKKSFDEMAEEMMRPMLQDWLDNNLPTLVERLVREEIERVARGGA